MQGGLPLFLGFGGSFLCAALHKVRDAAAIEISHGNAQGLGKPHDCIHFGLSDVSLILLNRNCSNPNAFRKLFLRKAFCFAVFFDVFTYRQSITPDQSHYTIFKVYIQDECTKNY